MLIDASVTILFKHFDPDNYLHLYFVEMFLINHISAIYFACLSIYLADSNLSAHYSNFSPPPP
jgi:hypothetical protein